MERWTYVCNTILFAFQDEKILKVSYHFVVHSKMYILIGTIDNNLSKVLEFKITNLYFKYFTEEESVRTKIAP